MTLGACADERERPKPLPTTNGKAPGDSLALTTASVPISADQVFSTRCATCHGYSGRGDGPGARALNPKPRSYTDPSWQKSVTDAQIRKTIVEGGPAVGKSSLMAPNADLADQPAVLDGLVKIVRGFGETGI
jgi:mono/diheme cytochrome c family protein